MSTKNILNIKMNALSELFSKKVMSNMLQAIFCQKLIIKIRNIYYLFYGVYPKILANEVDLVLGVLRSPSWNMMYGRGLIHEELESKFSSYIGVKHGVAVGSGGVGIQIALRALGLKPGDEVILQVDTCIATAFAVMNSGCTPIFCDVSLRTFMVDHSGIDILVGENTRAIIATHMWGNPDNLKFLKEYCDRKNIFLIEDGCLALGAKIDGVMSGSTGHVGIFSFGCLKPIQGGEGGMLVTNSDVLAKELKILRSWGDAERETGIRDAVQLSWNGRMSEIVAAVVLGQLNGYETHLQKIRDMSFQVNSYLINNFDGISPIFGSGLGPNDCGLTQLTYKLSDDDGFKKMKLMAFLRDNNISVWHANFELINSSSFFNKDKWRDWILKGDLEKVALNYNAKFPNAEKIFKEIGFGLPKINYINSTRVANLKKTFSKMRM